MSRSVPRAAQENEGVGAAPGSHLSQWGSDSGCVPDRSPPRVSPQSGQAYYINDGESVNLFEWMAPLVGAQTPPPTSENLGIPISSLPVTPFLFPEKTRFPIKDLQWQHCPPGDIGTGWSWVMAAPLGGHELPHFAIVPPSLCPNVCDFLLSGVLLVAQNEVSST